FLYIQFFMTTFESSIIIHHAVSEVYKFLADLNNHQQLMPENIYNWNSTHDTANFTIQNMAKLEVKVSERIENEKIAVIPSADAPFDFEMQWELTSDSGATHVV